MNAYKITGAILSITGVVLLTGALISVFSTQQFLKNSNLTQGRISDIVVSATQKVDDKTVTRQFPVVKYKDESGKTIEYRSETSFTKGIRIGMPVKLRYDKKNPEKARIISSFYDIWGISLVIAIFAVVITGIGFPLYVVNRRTAPVKNK